METENKHPKKLRKKNENKQVFEKRSPLKDLQIQNRRRIKKSSSSSIEETPKCSSLGFSNFRAAASSFSRSSQLDDEKFKSSSKPKETTASKILLARSRENGILSSKQPLILYHKSKNNHPPPSLLRPGQYVKTNAKQTSKLGQRSSRISSNPITTLKDFEEKIQDIYQGNNDSGIELVKMFDNINSNCVGNCTPVGKIVCGSGLDFTSSNFDENENNLEEDDSMSKIGGNCNTTSDVKTPPVEASLSPEVQFESHSMMMLVSESGATPVCYGAGHLLSGVTDKRKCRRRGSLKGGYEKAKIFHDEGNVISCCSQDSSIPLLAGASVNWHLSPCDEEDQSSVPGNKLEEQCGITLTHDDDDFVTLDLFSSPSSTCENCSTLSVGSLSNGNITHTPISNSGSYRYAMVEITQRNSFQSKLGSVTQALNRVALSPSEVSMWDTPGFGSSHFSSEAASSLYFANLTQLQKNVDSVSSWVSDSTLLENPQIRISWRDGIVEAGEFDYCRCLSDEEIDGGITEKENDPGTTGGLIRFYKSGSNNKSDMRSLDNDVSPTILDYEPIIISDKSKRNLSSHTCAESISTNGGGSLVASGNSDWTERFFNDLFEI